MDRDSCGLICPWPSKGLDKIHGPWKPIRTKPIKENLYTGKSTDEWPVHIMESQDAPPQKHWWWHIRIEYRKCKDQIWSAFSSYWACMNGLCLNTKASIPTRTLKVENSELTQKVLNLTGSGESIRPDSARLIYLPDLVSCRLNQTQASQDKSKLVFKLSCIWRGDMDRTRFNQSFLIFFFQTS